MKTPLLIAIAFTVAATTGCKTEIAGPDATIGPPRKVVSAGSDPAPATYFQGCIKPAGDIGSISSLGTSTKATVDCKGKETSIVLLAGTALNFCYKPGKEVTDFTTGLPACRRDSFPGGFAAGTGLLGCFAKDKLTGIGHDQPKCGKNDVPVGFSLPPDPPPCTSALAITGPVETVDGYATVHRSADFSITALLLNGCTDWTFSWEYKLGDDATAPVPGTWTGSSTASLTVPKWTLEKYPTSLRSYVFTATATPPAGTALLPVTASVHLRVLGTVPFALYSPRGFGTVAPGLTSYTSQAIDYDNAPGQAKLIYRWEAQSDQSETELIAPFAGIDTNQIQYVWDPIFGFVTLKLTVCPSDELNTPGSMPTGCGQFSDNFLILSA